MSSQSPPSRVEMSTTTQSTTSTDLGTATATQKEQTSSTTTATTGGNSTCGLSVLQTVPSRIFDAIKTIYMFETGTFHADNVKEAVREYLDGETGFEIEPDFRFQDYDWTTTKSLPPGKNEDGIFIHV